MSYLDDLALRLALGAAALPDALRSQHAAYLRTAQRPDGGWAGRRGDSDPYYTSFGLRAAGLVGALDEALLDRAAQFLRPLTDRPLPTVDLLSLAMSARLVARLGGPDVFRAAGIDLRAAVADRTAGFRRDDGGFAKTQQSGSSSTYHTFLVVATLEMLGAAIDDPAAIVALARGRQNDDGGFSELGPLKQSGLNPTAAAVGLLAMLGSLDDDIRARAAAYLAAMQTGAGGLRANARIPVADLLSTFTGLVALGDLGRPEQLDRPAAQRFVAALADPSGGFRAGEWDTDVDVEYTFYGLGSLALLSGL